MLTMYKESTCPACGKGFSLGDKIIYTHEAEVVKPPQAWRSQAKNEYGVKLARNKKIAFHEGCITFATPEKIPASDDSVLKWYNDNIEFLTKEYAGQHIAIAEVAGSYTVVAAGGFEAVVEAAKSLGLYDKAIFKYIYYWNAA